MKIFKYYLTNSINSVKIDAKEIIMINQKYLQSILNYDKDTGEFTWKVRKGARALQNTVAGTLDNTGYIHITIDKKVYQAHRLIWMYLYGQFPTEFLDHKNGNKSDNRLTNLRESTRAENGINRPKQSNNKSGYKGVYFHKQSNSYRAKITIDQKVKILGNHKTPEKAYLAYVNYCKEHLKDFTHTSLEVLPSLSIYEDI